MIKLIKKRNQSTYLNAQVNSANLGYHSILKYNKINCLVTNEIELRHEMRDKVSDVTFLAKKLQNKININKIVITRGKFGAILDKKLRIFLIVLHSLLLLLTKLELATLCFYNMLIY